MAGALKGFLQRAKLGAVTLKPGTQEIIKQARENSEHLSSALRPRLAKLLREVRKNQPAVRELLREQGHRWAATSDMSRAFRRNDYINRSRSAILSPENVHNIWQWQRAHHFPLPGMHPSNMKIRSNIRINTRNMKKRS